MGLYERLIGNNEPNKIPVHQFQATLGEFARGQITGAQAQTAIESMSGAPLTPAEVTEAQTLLSTITGNGVTKLARAKEIDDVLLLAEHGEIYLSPASVKTRLGV